MREDKVGIRHIASVWCRRRSREEQTDDSQCWCEIDERDERVLSSGAFAEHGKADEQGGHRISKHLCAGRGRRARHVHGGVEDGAVSV